VEMLIIIGDLCYAGFTNRTGVVVDFRRQRLAQSIEPN
jgi:hypothetical protein